MPARDHVVEALEFLDLATDEIDGETGQQRAIALTGIGHAVLALVDEARTQTLVGYLQALLADPKPGTDTFAQIAVVASVLERRLGLAAPESS